MRFPDLLRLALANLRRNRTRSLLTLVGVMIGVAALSALLAYGAGLQRNARSEFEALELYNTLRVTSTPVPFSGFGDFTATQREAAAEQNARVPLTDSLVQAVETMDGVLAAYPEVVFPVKLKAGRESAVASAEAVPQRFAEIPAYQPTEGRFFDSPAEAAVLLTPAMARRLGYDDPAQIVGDTLLAETATIDLVALQKSAQAISLGLMALPLQRRDYPLAVVGLLPEAESAVSGFVRVLVPLERAKQMRKVTFFSTLDLLLSDARTGGYMAVRVQLDDFDAYGPVRRTLEEQGLFVTSFREQFSQLERLFVIMDLALGIIGFIALLVATIGIANTMMMNVMERTREIGVMKAVGGDERDLQSLFVVESALLGLAGGLLGLALGWAVTAVIQFGVDTYLRRLGVPTLDVFHNPLAMLLAVLGVALLVSLVAGFAPARRAARVEPIEALRSA